MLSDDADAAVATTPAAYAECGAVPAMPASTLEYRCSHGVIGPEVVDCCQL